MLFNAVPNITDDDEKDEPSNQSLRILLNKQHLSGFRNAVLNSQDIEKYTQKLAAIAQNQTDRFSKMDELIIDNIYALKKNKTTDRNMVTYGKEVRKLEAGLRTLRLFAQDILEMLQPNSQKINRADERMYYFLKRSAVLQVEMNHQQNTLSFI